MSTLVISSKHVESKDPEKAAMDVLYNELSKGIQSMKNGDVYSVEDAWEEIDKK